MDAALVERIKAEMAYEFGRTEPPEGFPKLPDIPGRRYVDPAFWELEQSHLWNKVWVIAGRVEDLPGAGSYRTFDGLGAPVLLVRGNDDRIRAFYNSCQHRGAPVVRDACGTAQRLRCQYHSWTYDSTSGALISVPDERDFVGLCKEDRPLQQLRCETWGGWIFVNQDQDAMPLLDWLGPVPAQLAELQPENLRALHHDSLTLTCNWKVVLEAFMEVYHFRHIHGREKGPILDSRGAVMSLLPNGHSRMITPFARRICETLGMTDWSDWKQFAAPGFTDIPTASEIIRSTNVSYGLFPNVFTPLEASGFPIHIVWPVDIRTTRMDVIHYSLGWEGGELPDAWKWRLKEYDRIMDEDTFNLNPMQRSLESPGFRSVPLNYQERRIWHFHEQIDRMIGAERIPEELRIPQLLAGYLTD